MRHLVAVSLLLLAAAARPAPATPAQRLRADAEERARSEIADLFRSLCPEQCVLLGVQARVQEETLGEGDPGFESLQGGRAPVLRGISANVVVDSQLPSAFRTNVKKLVTERLSALGAPASVAVERVSFPVRNPPHLEAPERAPLPPAAAAPPSEPERAPRERALERLADAAPVIAVVALLALAVALLGALVYLALRRNADAAFAWAPEPGADAPAPERAPAAEEFPAVRARKLAKTLADERPVRNAVVRDALARGEAPLVARWVRELGDFLVEDLRGDASVGPALEALASELVRPDAAADAGTRRVEAMRALEGRVAAARLSRPAEAADEAFAFLEGVRPDLFASACCEASAGTAEVALRYAPPRLRAAALEALPRARRDEIALAWAARPEVATEYAVAAADEMRERLARTSGGAAQADRVLSELLDGLPRDEQDALVARVAAQSGARGASLVTESTAANAPADLLAAAALAVGPARLRAFLAGTDGDVRDRVIAALPGRFRAEVEEEVGMGVAPSRAEFLEARRAVLAALRDEAARRGTPLADLRAAPRPRLVDRSD